MTSSSAEHSEEPAELLGQLAYEVSLLSRRELELAAAEQLPALRGTALEAAALIYAGMALLLALGTFTWLAVRALSAALPSWVALLVAAAGWATIAALFGLWLARLGRRTERTANVTPRLAWLRRQTQSRIIETRRDARTDAEQTVRGTAHRLSAAVLKQAGEHAVEAVLAVPVREVGKAGARTEKLATDALAALTAPARVSVGILLTFLRHPTRESDNGEQVDVRNRHANRTTTT